MKRVRRPGLTGLLALAFCLLALTMAALLSELLIHTAGAQMKDDIGSGLTGLAQQTVDKLDREMYERYREVQLMAQRPDLAGGVAPAQRRRTLAQRQQSYPLYAWLGVTDRQGRVAVASGGLLEGADVSARAWYRGALEGLHVGDVRNALLLAKLLPQADGEPLRFLDLAFPLADGSGVLGAHLSWAWARDIERAVFAPVSARHRVEAMILDRQGKVLLGPHSLLGKQLDLPSSGNAASHGYVVERWADGRDYLVGYSRSSGHAGYPGLGWTVLVRQEVDEAWAPVRALQRRSWWLGLAMAALFALLALPLAARITRPLRALAEGAEQIRRNTGGRLPPLAAYAEVQTLSRTLNALVDNMEERVNRRTAELRGVSQRLAAILDSAQDAFVAVAPDGRIVQWNPAAERMFGWPRDEALGRHYIDLIVPQRFRARQQAAHALGAGDPGASGQRLQRTLIARDGTELVVEASISRPEPDLLCAFLHDISERRQVEQMKNEFIATVSHELRTPMTSISASLSLLAEGGAGTLGEDARLLVGIAHQSSERLVRLLNDMLDLEKMEAGKMELRLQRQPLAPLLAQALDAVRGSAAQRPVVLDVEGEAGGLAVLGDHDRLIQVLVNLLSNAIKYSPPYNSVVLACHGGDGTVRLSVSDNGPGIPAEFRARIFDKFAQADSSDTRLKGGTGLGLAICRVIVAQHGGQIGFDSEEGRGATFHLTLPLLS